MTTKATTKKKVKKSVTKEPVLKSEKKKKIVKRTYIFTVGRRKSAIARVRYYKKGEGKIIVNDKDYKTYFPEPEFQRTVVSPLEKSGFKNDGQITIKVKGGGKRGQAESIRLGIARFLILIDKSYRKPLKVEGFLKRDPRVKERKKYGLKRARRAPQWQKR